MKKVSFRNARLILKMIRISYQIRPRAVIGYYVAALMEIISFLATIYASAQIAGLLARYTPGSDASELWFWLIIDIAAASATGLSAWGLTWSKRLIYFRATAWAMTEAHAAFARLDIADFSDPGIRNQINKVKEGYTWKPSNLCDSSLDLSYGIIRFVVTAVVVAQISWWLIPIIIAFLIPSLFVERKMSKQRWYAWDREGDDRHIFWGLTAQLTWPNPLMELRSMQAKDYILKRLEGINRKFYSTQEAENAKINRFFVPAKFLENGGTAIGLVLLLRQFIAGAISIERYFFISGALLRIGGALANIFGTLARMYEDLLYIEDFFSLIERQPTIVDKPNAIRIKKSNPPSIEFKDVTFTYPHQTKPTLENLTFSIPSGTHIALVGENGAGKSTIIKLLLRYYIPDSGQILIDGIDLQDIAIESWYSHIATLFQDFNKYALPIGENIEIGRPEFAGNEKRLAKSAKLANVDIMMKDFPHGWDTVLNSSFEKGIEPSGGQWQRVALARSFYRQASVLILDEPTAAIDAKAEYEIFNNIFEHNQKNTAIIVSHRFSTVRRADKIIVLQDGAILEHGNHKSLMRHKGVYYDLFTKQAEGYKN